MQINEERQKGAVVVAPVGRIDTTTSSTLEQHLTTILSGEERRVVVDFTGVDYISSAGLRVMLMLAKRAKEVNGKVALCGMRDVVRQVFNLAGFTALFAIEASREAAIGRVAG